MLRCKATTRLHDTVHILYSYAHGILPRGRQTEQSDSAVYISIQCGTILGRGLEFDHGDEVSTIHRVRDIDKKGEMHATFPRLRAVHKSMGSV